MADHDNFHLWRGTAINVALLDHDLHLDGAGDCLQPELRADHHCRLHLSRNVSKSVSDSVGDSFELA